MQILILMAGSGHRFRQAGYKDHKPMIDVNGKPMIERVIENLTPKYRDHKFIFVTLSNMLDERTRDILRKTKGTIIELPSITEGAVSSALTAQGVVDPNDSLLIASCDQLVDIDIDEFIDASWFSDGALLTFPSDRPHCSYVELGEDGNAVRVAEKEVISNHANIGLYFYKKTYYFFEYARRMVNRDDRFNGEFYNAPVYNYLIKDGLKVTIHEIPVEKVHLLGTPKELNDYTKAIAEVSR